jgi:hypothetical protein
MTGVRFADVQGRPAEFLNLTSLTLEEFEVAPFEFQGRRGASMGVARQSKPCSLRQSGLTDACECRPA